MKASGAPILASCSRHSAMLRARRGAMAPMAVSPPASFARVGEPSDREPRRASLALRRRSHKQRPEPGLVAVVGGAPALMVMLGAHPVGGDWDQIDEVVPAGGRVDQAAADHLTLGEDQVAD